MTKNEKITLLFLCTFDFFCRKKIITQHLPLKMPRALPRPQMSNVYISYCNGQTLGRNVKQLKCSLMYFNYSITILLPLTLVGPFVSFGVKRRSSGSQGRDKYISLLYFVSSFLFDTLIPLIIINPLYFFQWEQ